jgi:hypothetical protein
MGMAKYKIKRISLVLLVIGSIAMLVAGCKGQAEAPFGSTIEISAFGAPEITNPVSTPTLTAITAKTQKYLVTVLDPDGLPLNGAAVNFYGVLTSGKNVDFDGKIGSAPDTIFVIKPTDDFGFLFLNVTTSYYKFEAIHVPYNQAAVGVPDGGQLPDGTYCYTVTALDYAGETNATASVSAIVSGTSTTSPSGMVTVSWQAVPGASSYRVYGRTCGTERALIDILSPPVGNTTGLSLNAVRGSIYATTGAASAQTDMNF